MKRFYYLNIIFLFMSFTALTQVNFTTKVSKNTLGINERVKVEFKIDEDGDNFIPPNFDNFLVVQGPSQSINYSWINGKKSYSKTYSYFLSPTKKGIFEIGQASIEVDGEIYKTLPVQINITSAVDQPTDSNDPNYIANNNVHLIAEVSNKNPFLNEAISITYKLYFSPDIQIEINNELESPRYVDFWSDNIDLGTPKIQNGTFKGQPYRYVIIKQTVLYPQKTGNLKIEPYTLDILVQVPSNRRDFFGQRIASSVNKTVSAGRMSINVKPLPTLNQPQDFSGAVGDFNFEVSSNKDNLILGEAFQLNLKILGQGNFNLFDDPVINLPRSLEVYEPEKTSDIFVKNIGMSGNISNMFTIVPTKPGKYKIPKTEFSFFNPSTEQYKTIYSDPILINIDSNFLNNANSDMLSENNDSEKINSDVISKNQFSSFKTKTNFSKIDQKILFNSVNYWILIFLPILLIVIIVVVTRLIKYLSGRKTDNLDKSVKIANKYLEQSKYNIGNKDKFYELMEKALFTYLKAKLKLKNSNFNTDEIRSKLSKLNIEKSDIKLLFDLFENCQLARYTPLDVNEMSQDYENAKLFIQIVEKIKK
tara:strand:+ start:219 stop:1991 length:1773 start_codon:yes stop_codon:yes gene_type:complete